MTALVIVCMDARDKKLEAERQDKLEHMRALEVARPALPPDAAESNKRFEVHSEGTFFAGLENHKREILIIKDTQTGRSYLAVTGCGTCEMHTETYHEGKATKTRDVEE